MCAKGTGPQDISFCFNVSSNTYIFILLLLSQQNAVKVNVYLVLAFWCQMLTNDQEVVPFWC